MFMAEGYISQSALSCVLEVDNCRNYASIRLCLGMCVTLALGEIHGPVSKPQESKAYCKRRVLKAHSGDYIAFLFLESSMII